MFDWLTHEVSQSAITYPVIALACATDVLIPLVPSETIVITASVLAAQGELFIWLIVPAVAIGAFVGDNLCYLLGRKIGDPIAGRLFRGEKGQARLNWAERALRRRGAILIAVGRFIPGGRTATTFAAGTLEMPYRQFVVADAFAAGIWALYISMLGYLGGETFKDSLWLPLATSFAAAMLVGPRFRDLAPPAGPPRQGHPRRRAAGGGDRPLRLHPAHAGFEAGRVSGTGSNDPSPETLFWRPRSAFARASSPAFGVTAIHLA